jgi:HD-like signal output (HDOD) protein
VDDEPNVLEGLRTLLRRQRHAWDMAFAGSGEEALAALEAGPFDVVVTDMRMPGMDGAALLRHVQARHPGVARIVLSGHAERETVVRAVPVAHQILGKPCDAEALRGCVERTCELQALVGNPAIRELVGRLAGLPSVARTYAALSEAIAGQSAGAAEIARIVETDSAMSAKVLQLANSGFFAGGPRKVSVSSAITFLGVELLKTLALSAHLFTALDEDVAREFGLERLQVCALAAARLTRQLVADRARAEEAFTAGLVHDVGRVVLAVGMPDEYRGVLRDAAASGWPLHVVEKEALGVSHAEVGASLLGIWGLPFSIVEVVAYHHDPGAAQRHVRELAAAVHVGEALAIGGPDGALDTASLEQAGVLDRLERWRAEAAALEAPPPGPDR